MPFAQTPEPPYWAVVFTSLRAGASSDDGYGETALRMEELARASPGFLGIESARGPDGIGITVSYWASEEAIARWKGQVDHREAQRAGRARWYDTYAVRVCRVERAYGFPAR